MKTNQTDLEQEGGDPQGSRKRAELGQRRQYPLRLPEEMHDDYEGFAKEDGVTLHAYFMKVLADHWRRKKRRKNKE